MAYIYKITNKINQKSYIGKTLGTIKGRFIEHIRDSRKERTEKRPLYSAMNKYGVENFSIEEIEQCSYEVVNERETYWIQYYGTFLNGYNATIGGDGNHYADYDLIFSLFQEGKNITEISEITKYCTDTVTLALSSKGVSDEEKQERCNESKGVKIAKLDKNTGEILEVYSSIAQAYRELGKQHSGHIASVCKGKRKSAYGFEWKYI